MEGSVSSVEQILHGFDSKLKEMEETLDHVMIDLSEEQTDIENASNSIQQFNKPTKDENMDNGDFLEYLNAEYSTLLQENENLQSLVHEAKGEIKTLKNEKDKALDAIDKLQSQLESATSFESRNHTLSSSSFDDSTNRGSVSDATIQDLEKVVQSSKGKIEELEFSLATSTINLDEAEREKRKLIDRIKTISAENASAKFMMTEICCALESTAEKLSPQQTGTLVNGDSTVERIQKIIRPKKIGDKDNLLSQIDYADALFNFILTESNREINNLRKSSNSEIGVVQSQIKAMKDIQECTSEKLEILIGEKNKADRTILELTDQIKTLRSNKKLAMKEENKDEIVRESRKMQQGIDQYKPSTLEVEDTKERKKAASHLNSVNRQQTRTIERTISDDIVEDNREDLDDGYNTLIEAEIKGIITSLHEDKDFDSGHQNYVLQDFSVPGESIDNDTLVTHDGGISALIEAEVNETVAYLQYERESQPNEGHFVYPELEKVATMKRKVKALNIDSRSPIDDIDPIADRDDCDIILRRDRDEHQREEMRDDIRDEGLCEARDFGGDDEMEKFNFFYQRKIEADFDNDKRTHENKEFLIYINDERRNTTIAQNTSHISGLADIDNMEVMANKSISDSICVVDEFAMNTTIKNEWQGENHTIKNAVENKICEFQTKVDEVREEFENSGFGNPSVMQGMMNKTITDSRSDVCPTADIDEFKDVTTDINTAQDAFETSDLASKVQMEVTVTKSISDLISNVDECVADTDPNISTSTIEEECQDENDPQENISDGSVSNSLLVKVEESVGKTENSGFGDPITTNASICISKLDNDSANTVILKEKERDLDKVQNVSEDFTDIPNGEDEVNQSISDSTSYVDECASDTDLDVNVTIYYDCQDDVIEYDANEVNDAVSSEEYGNSEFSDATSILNESISQVEESTVNTNIVKEVRDVDVHRNVCENTHSFKEEIRDRDVPHDASENSDYVVVNNVDETEENCDSSCVIYDGVSDEDVHDVNATINENFHDSNNSVNHLKEDLSKKADFNEADRPKLTTSTKSDVLVIDNDHQYDKDAMEIDAKSDILVVDNDYRDGKDAMEKETESDVLVIDNDHQHEKDAIEIDAESDVLVIDNDDQNDATEKNAESDVLVIGNDYRDDKDEMEKDGDGVIGTNLISNYDEENDSEYDEKDFINEKLKSKEFTNNAKDTGKKAIVKRVTFLIDDENSGDDVMEEPLRKKDYEKHDEFIGQRMDEQGSDTFSASYSCHSNDMYNENIRSHFSSSSDESSYEDLRENDAFQKDDRDEKSVYDDTDNIENDDINYDSFSDESDYNDCAYSDESDEDDANVENFLDEEYNVLNEENVIYERDIRSEYLSEATLCSRNATKNDGDISLMIQSPKHEKQMIHKPLLRQRKMPRLQRAMMKYKKAKARTKARTKAKTNKLKTIPEIPENQSTRGKFFRFRSRKRSILALIIKKFSMKKEKKKKRKRRFVRMMASAALTSRLIKRCK